MNKVSICLCTYNGELFLEEQLASIVSQTYKNIEIIVVDDCSTDNTLLILEKFSNLDNLKIFKNESNLGYIKNFEKAIQLCKGDFIALADQDDIWYPEKIDTLVRNINEHVLIYHNSEYVDDSGKLLHQNLFDHKKYLTGSHPLSFVYGSCITGHTVLFKKDLCNYIFPFPQEFFHDWWISYVASSVGSIHYFNKILVKYRHHTNNVIAGKCLSKSPKSKKRSNNIIDRLIVLRDFKFIKSHEKSILENLIEGYTELKKWRFSFKLLKTIIKNHQDLLRLKNPSYLKIITFAIKESSRRNLI